MTHWRESSEVRYSVCQKLLDKNGALHQAVREKRLLNNRAQEAGSFHPEEEKWP